MDDFENNEENISLMLVSADQTINYYPITVKKYFTCSQLIFYINQVIKENYKGFADMTNLIIMCNGNVLPFSSVSLESAKIYDGSKLFLMKVEEEDDNENLNIKKVDGSITITALSRQEEIFLSIIVDINMTSAHLITLLNQLIKNAFPQNVKNGYFFIHNNKKLNFDAHNLKYLNFKDKDKILICRIEDANIIDDDCNLVNFKKLDDLITVKLISPDQTLHLAVNVNNNYTCTQFINALIKKIIQFCPQKSENEFYFFWNGLKLNYSSNTIYSLGIRNGSVIMAMEVAPLFKENLELNVSIIIDEDNKH